jgi:hypothetical protein
MNPRPVTAIINCKRYDTETATLLAGDDWWDGHNYERRGRQRYLYRSARGSFFLVTLSQWQGEPSERLEVVAQEQAIALWEELREHREPFSEAFPGVELEEG